LTRTLSTQIVEGPTSRLELDGAEVQVVSGPDRGTKLELGADSILIGSSQECQLILHDPTVSTRHAEIVVSASGYAIRDLGSKNGILLGTTLIERAPLQDGMRLQLGTSAISIRSTNERQTINLSAAGEFGQLVAHSVKMRALVSILERLASSDASVLIEGETGTGKELVAQSLHEASARKHGKFVIFDCGAVTPSLMAADLFGYEKGAFTGADSAKAGLFEEADGGTLFLDELGELPLELQPLLLGAIERQVSRRVGGRSDVRHDVRVIAATNRNLGEEVRAGRFREDLFYRLAVARVRVPPLRERPEDLPRLADEFAQEVGIVLPTEALAAFSAYEWPGNIRELRNLVFRLAVDPNATVEASSGISEDDMLLRPMPEARRIASSEFERRYLENVLERAGGKISHAAELAGISRRVFTSLVAKHNLRVRDRQ
jgi:DNA-binding NtrC family response regulator